MPLSIVPVFIRLQKLVTKTEFIKQGQLDNIIQSAKLDSSSLKKDIEIELRKSFSICEIMLKLCYNETLYNYSSI